jgi:DNA-binding NarL/FixJ family response regulator
MARKKAILIVDDHPFVREGLKSIIKSNDALEVIGEAENVRSARKLIKALKPDLVLLDLGLPDESGFDLAREIRRMMPNTRVTIERIEAFSGYGLRVIE